MTGQRHLLYVLALAEAGLAMLAGLGETIAMAGNGWYALWGAAVAALYIVAGLKGARGRRWALLVLITVESVRLVGVLLSIAVGFLPWVQATFTATSVVDSVLLPVAVLWLSAAILRPPLRRVAGAEQPMSPLRRVAGAEQPMSPPAPAPAPLARTRALPTEAVSPAWAAAYIGGAR